MYVMPRTESLAQGVALRHRHNSETAERRWQAGPPNACCGNAVLIPGMGTPSPVSKHTALECSRASRFTRGVGLGISPTTLQRCNALWRTGLGSRLKVIARELGPAGGSKIARPRGVFRARSSAYSAG